MQFEGEASVAVWCKVNPNKLLTILKYHAIVIHKFG